MRKKILTSAAICFCLVIAVGCKPTAVPNQSQDAKILTNQVGYDASGPKKAVIQAHAGDVFTAFTVKSFPGGEIVLSGTPRHDGPVRKWKDWDFWTVDWSAVDKEGAYIIECASQAGAAAGAVRSHPVLVQKNSLERNTLSDVIYYFKGQRSSGLWDKADRKMTFEGKSGTVDMRGGWFDASGDYGKHLSHLSFSTYFNPQQVSLTAWSLFGTLRELERRGEPYFKQYQKRLLDEALFGADYLVRSKNPKGSFYITVSGRGPEKKPEDRRISAKAERHIILTPETKDKFRDYGREKIAGDAAYEAGWREGAGLSIAALAMAAARGGAPGSEGYGMSKGEGDFKSADYLKAAEDAFAFLEKNNLLFANDGKENILDDYCALVAATELFRTTKKSVYREAADKRAASLAARLTSGVTYENYWRADDGDRPFFHPVDAGLPVISLLGYAEIADEAGRATALDAVRKSLGFELAVTAEVANPFGYSRQLVQSKGGAATRRTSFFFPHDTETAPWWQGENARLGSMAAAARLAARYFGTDAAFADKLRAFGRDQMNWILGLNPFDSCMLHAKGRNNIAYMFFDSYEYTNAPGGICNGITGGYTDEEDIDFGLRYAATGKDDDWRWAEQWLPHAAWYLYAVAIGD
ncbi:MAG TPA: glycoside hydrolase family 9 protein [Sumerlaeia bacterium]|nr:glycoside hydrolase family 9 protein [Sumerlaeia bacterium]